VLVPAGLAGQLAGLLGSKREALNRIGAPGPGARGAKAGARSVGRATAYLRQMLYLREILR
jgi:hypothetical protein